MSLYYLAILALVQGLTEFLPVSSSGHLVLVHEAAGGDLSQRWHEDLMLDTAVHVGTLLSVLIYFRHDVLHMLGGVYRVFKPRAKGVAAGGGDDFGIRLFLYVVLGSLPVIAAGFFLHLYEPSWLRSVKVMAWATIIFGVVLWWVDVRRPLEKGVEALTWRHALWIGLAQVLALIPGTSRSGITMTAARWFGFKRTEAARYSLLLSIVAISGAGTLGGIDLLRSGDLMLTLDVFIAMVLAFVSGLLAIAVMMHWLEKASFAVFGLYRILLGAGLLGLLYTGVI